MDLEEPWKYDMQELGFNYRMSELHASLGNISIKKNKRFFKKRREIVLYYIDRS